MQNHEFLIYRLSHASQEVVYSWLEDNQPRQGYPSFRSHSHSEELEESLLSRKEPLVKLGLALYGYEGATGIKLYKESDEFIKKAVLSGTTIRTPIHSVSWLVSTGILSELLDLKNLDLLGKLLSNPNIDVKILVNLYQKEKIFNKVDDEFWLELLDKSFDNPILSTLYDNSHYKQGSGDLNDYTYSSVFEAGWKLFEVLPVNDDSAYLLSYLGRKLVPRYSPPMNVTKVIERWKIHNTDNDYSYSLCRTALANCIFDFETEFKNLKDSTDFALRKSYYRRFSPLKKEEVRELFEKDNNIFLESALENKILYRKKDIRHELFECCYDYKYPDHLMDSPHYLHTFERHVEQLSKAYPEWFEDLDGEIPVDAIEDPMDRANKQLSHIVRKMNKISEKLFETRDEESPLFEEIRNSLNRIEGYVYNPKSAPSYGWVMAVVGFLIGYVVAR